MNRRQVAARGRGQDNRPAWLVERERQGPNELAPRNEIPITKISPGRPPSKRQRTVPVPEVETVVTGDKDRQESVAVDTQTNYQQIRLKEENEELLRLAHDFQQDGNCGFVSQHQKEEEGARQRREKRQRRLRQAAVLEQQQSIPCEVPSPASILVPVIAEMNGSVSITIPTEQESISDTGSGDNQSDKGSKKDDEFDMFSSSMSPPTLASNHQKQAAMGVSLKQQHGQHHQQDWDDDEGYFKPTVGEIIDFAPQTFRVLGIVGKGVFSTVLKCETLPLSESTPNNMPKITAIKLIRHNETMAKAAMTEIRLLQKLQDCSGICSLRMPIRLNNTSGHQNNASSNTTLEHKGHVGLVFDYAPYNLRHVLQKFGKGVGLTLEGVRTYFSQLVQALQHLEKHNIIHADLKPDNILVSADFSQVQICDFGSAFEVGSDNVPTPYLVSRFYRAPEIVLGLIPTTSIDIWSVAVSMGELFLGRVLFDGRSNNNMTLKFMEHLGCFSNRILKQHAIACRKFPLEQHFIAKEGGTFDFHKIASDKVTGKPVTISVPLLQSTFPKTPLQTLLLKAKSQKDTRTQVLHLSDLMHKCLALDPSRRIPLAQALEHDFFATTNAPTLSVTITA